MATISKKWSSQYQHDWNDSSWTTGTPTTATNAIVDTTEEYTGDIDLETGGYVSSMVEVQVNYPASADQNIVVSVYPSLDETYDSGDQEVAIFSSEIGLVVSDIVFFSFFVPDVPHYRLGFKHAAVATNDATIEAIHYQAWNYQSA